MGNCLAYSADPATTILTYERGDACGNVTNPAEDLNRIADAVNKRLGRDGKAKVVSADRLEVEVFGVQDKSQLLRIKSRIGQDVCVEFRIVADSNFASDEPIIQRALRLSPDEKNVVTEDKTVAKWVPYFVKEFGPVDQADLGMVKRLSEKVPEALILVDDNNLMGFDLTAVQKSLDDQGNEMISVQLSDAGAKKLKKLTGDNLPAASKYRRLGVVLDNTLLLAPIIHTTISEAALLSFGATKGKELDAIVGVLNLSKVSRPIHLVSEKQITPDK